MPRRLDIVRFHIGDDHVEVAFQVALELAERASRVMDEHARRAADRIRGAGASWPIVLTREQQEALARVIDEWERDADTVRRLRKRLPR